MSEIVQAQETAPAPTIDSTMSVFERVLRDDTIPTDRLREVMVEMRLYAEQIAERDFFEALARAQANFGTITQNREVDYTSTKGRTHYKFEDLQEIERAIRQPLAAEGITYTWHTEQLDARTVRVTCRMRRGIHKEETPLQAPVDDSGGKNAVQQIGSTVTYLQRYTLKGAAGLAVAHDDDANGPQAQAAGPISAAQYIELQEWITKSETDLPKLLRWAAKRWPGIESLEGFNQDAYESAMQMMRDKMGQSKVEGS